MRLFARVGLPKEPEVQGEVHEQIFPGPCFCLSGLVTAFPMQGGQQRDQQTSVASACVPRARVPLGAWKNLVQITYESYEHGEPSRET